MTTHTWLVILSSDQCRRRLAEATLGRLAVIVDGRPEIYPINHVYDHDTSTVAFPTNTGTKLHSALHWPWVGFEVDGLEGNQRAPRSGESATPHAGSASSTRRSPDARFAAPGMRGASAGIAVAPDRAKPPARRPSSDHPHRGLAESFSSRRDVHPQLAQYPRALRRRP